MPRKRGPLGASAPPPQPAVRPATFSWYPPHMHRAYRRLREEIKDIDVVLEIRDARLPLTSSNPELGQLIGKKKRILLFNKAQLAAPAATAAWQEYFRGVGVPVLFLDAEQGRGINLIFPLIRELVAPTLANLQRRGIRPPQQRLMVAGIPNVGKSTLINRLLHRKRLRTAPSPGVTRAVEWVVVKNRYLLMDTPGLVLPKLDVPGAAEKLGWIAAIPDSAVGPEKLAAPLLALLAARVPRELAQVYGFEPDFPAAGAPLLPLLAAARSLQARGGAPDTLRAAEMVLRDFRAGKLGRVTLEEPPPQ